MPDFKFSDARHQQLSHFLKQAQATGILGDNLPGENPSKPRLLKSIFQTFPLGTILSQLIWSSLMVLLSFYVSSNQTATSNLSTLSIQFWISRVNVSSSVTFGIGWALFVLLGFYIREASSRYIQAQTSVHRTGGMLCRMVRVVRQVFPLNTWHEGDRDRIIAHLLAYPLALKMSLRGERDVELLKVVLHERDAEDVVSAKSMHFHCMRVVKSYLIVQDDGSGEFKDCNSTNQCHPGVLTRMIMGVMTDGVDEASISAFRISQFRPSLAYINHLQIFLYIWMMFLPIAIVRTSGWSTILWSVLITYAVAMLMLIAQALDEPFGFDEQDIKLNVLCAGISHNILIDAYLIKLEYDDVIDKAHETPTWLEEYIESSASTSSPSPSNTNEMTGQKTAAFKSSKGHFRKSMGIIISMILFSMWCGLVIFLTWAFRNDVQKPTVRWWSIYIPINSATAGYLSLCVFVLLGFWLNDSYNRYWTALQLWKTGLHPMITQYAFHIATCAKRGHWHDRDRERMLSFLTALPYTLALHLRNSRDLTSISDILSPKDVKAIESSRSMPAHIMNVMYGYLRSSDRRHFKGTDKFMVPLSIEPNNFPKLENLVTSCEVLQKFTISPAFQLHLNTITIMWLLILPITLVLSTGFVGFAFVLPIGYSIIKLLTVGKELSDPFGEDAIDLDLDSFCEQMKQSVRIIYKETSTPIEARHYIRASSTYNRSSMIPQRQQQDSDQNHHQNEMTPRKILFQIVGVFPRVPVFPLCLAVTWSVVAVCGSYGLSKVWPIAKRDACNAWCSPIDVPPAVLGNVGYALFLILAFRASDALSRYDDGTATFTELQMHLRIAAIEGVQYMADGTYHVGDKERIVAHLTHIPLHFCDLLLGTTLGNGGFLCKEDRELFNNSEDQMDYLIKTVEAYFLVPDILDIGGDGEQLGIRKGPMLPQVTFTASMRMGRVRSLVAKALTVKNYPIVKSYRKHQQLFSGMWLMLLPLAMTAQTGFFTILWSSLIAYSVLGMEEIAIRLVDPYGEDSCDLPVRDLCENISANVIDAVTANGWDCNVDVRTSIVAHDASLGVVLDGTNIYNKHTVASTAPEQHDVVISDDTDGDVEFFAPREVRTKPTIWAHLVHSVPWWGLIAISMYTTFAVGISYVTRDRSLSDTERWWSSFISISPNVAKYISTATLALLGFYVQSAFLRYNLGGKIWGDELQGYLHKLTSEFLYFFPENELHQDDHRRIIGHIAALPLVLKQELRHSRDLRELKGLLSTDDIGRFLCSTSMSAVCVDVLRGYFYKVMSRRSTVQSDKVNPGLVFIPIWIDIRSLEKSVEMIKRLNDFDIAPAFTVLLRALLGLWFMVLPFVLAEISGWFTILWTFIIAFGVLGVYNVAQELHHPFGNDVNDLDLDKLADDIVRDILQTYRLRKGNEKKEYGNITKTIWKKDNNDADNNDNNQTIFDELNKKLSWKGSLKLAFYAVPWWILLLSAVWSTLCVAIAWVVSREFPQSGGNTKCGQWFCSAIAADKNLKEYLGFALFLLLGFRLNDSHNRYVRALQIWQDRIIGSSRILAQRLLGSHTSSPSWISEQKENGRGYLVGHIVAFSICLMSSLREGKDYTEKLRAVLSEEDIKRIMKRRQRADYCEDVILNYIMNGERNVKGIAKMELMGILINWRKLGMTANDCEVMKKIPMPYGYVTHLRIFLVTWIVLLPLGLVESSGWLTILWVVVITYGVVGIERWAEELSDPFGFDISDIPLERLCDVVSNAVNHEFIIYQKGIKPFIRNDRPPYHGLPNNFVQSNNSDGVV